MQINVDVLEMGEKYTKKNRLYVIKIVMFILK